MRLRCVGRFFNALPLQITRPKKTNCDPDDSSSREYRVRERRERRERERDPSVRNTTTATPENLSGGFSLKLFRLFSVEEEEIQKKYV